MSDLDEINMYENFLNNESMLTRTFPAGFRRIWTGKVTLGPLIRNATFSRVLSWARLSSAEG